MFVQRNEEYENQLKKQLLDAIEYYINRQKIVSQALTDLGFDVTTDVEVDNRQSYISMQKWMTHAKEVPDSGIWIDTNNDEWQYLIHGAGCQLTNKKTGEPIDWDVPRINSFTPMFFYNHLFWQFKAHNRFDKVNLIRGRLTGLVNQLIEELVEKGEINKDYSIPNKENKA